MWNSTNYSTNPRSKFNMQFDKVVKRMKLLDIVIWLSGKNVMRRGTLAWIIFRGDALHKPRPLSAL